MANFILDEDEALKYLLQGMTVTDNAAPPEGRPVKVWFRLPQQELQEREYPYVTIDLISLNHATEREHRGTLRWRDPEGDLPYDIEGLEEPADGETVLVDYPIPYDLIYQVTTWARFAWHDRQIMVWLLRRLLPHRFGQLVVKDTVRRLDLVSVVPADTVDENNKRLFRKIFTISISSEMVNADVDRALQAIEIEPSVTPYEELPLDQDPALNP